MESGRTDGKEEVDLRSLRRRRGQGSKLPPFVPLIWELLNSAAFRKLPFAAAKALPYFLGKVKVSFNDPIRYETPFRLSYPEAKKLGFAAATFSKIIQDLIRFGFIDPKEKGGLRGAGKGYNEFVVSPRWQFYGKPEFEPLEWKLFSGKGCTKVTSKSETE